MPAQGTDELLIRRAGAYERLTVQELLADLESEIMPATTITTSSVSLAAGVSQQLPNTPVAKRRSIIITNVSGEDVWYGDSGVVVGEGTILKAGEKNSLDLSTGLYAICANSADIEINELS